MCLCVCVCVFFFFQAEDGIQVYDVTGVQTWALPIYGEFVVDLWAGDADQNGTPWEKDTIVNVYSTTKTMAAICVLMLADRCDREDRKERQHQLHRAQRDRAGRKQASANDQPDGGQHNDQ